MAVEDSGLKIRNHLVLRESAHVAGRCVYDSAVKSWASWREVIASLMGAAAMWTERARPYDAANRNQKRAENGPSPDATLLRGSVRESSRHKHLASLRKVLAANLTDIYGDLSSNY